MTSATPSSIMAGNSPAWSHSTLVPVGHARSGWARIHALTSADHH